MHWLIYILDNWENAKSKDDISHGRWGVTKNDRIGNIKSRKFIVFESFTFLMFNARWHKDLKKIEYWKIKKKNTSYFYMKYTSSSTSKLYDLLS